MDEKDFERWELQVRSWAVDFKYPRTPNAATAVKLRLQVEGKQFTLAVSKKVWAVIVTIFILIIGSLAVPPVRAAVLEYLQLGAVRIFQGAPTATSIPTMTEPSLPAAFTTPLPGATFSPTPTDLMSILDLDGETSLVEARTRTQLPIRLPSYPPDLGQPEHVFVQEMEGWVVILVWTQTGQPDLVRLSLHMISEGAFAVEKVKPEIIQQTTVNGRPALWTSGPYMVRLFNRDFSLRRLVDGNVLIWVEEPITYRLETDLPLEEVVRIAESLQ